MLKAHTVLSSASCPTVSAVLQHRASRTLRHLGAGHLKPGRICFQGESKAHADLLAVLLSIMLRGRTVCASKHNSCQLRNCWSILLLRALTLVQGQAKGNKQLILKQQHLPLFQQGGQKMQKVQS